MYAELDRFLTERETGEGIEPGDDDQESIYDPGLDPDEEEFPFPSREPW